MADVQISEPLVGENFTDRGWRAAFAGRTGVISDADGSSFGLTLPAEGATAELGSATQPSRLVVDGYGLEVAQGATQSLGIPASSGGGTNGRTDLIVARLNLSSFTTAPGPVRLVRIAGTEGSLSVPAATYDQDGIRDLPLYAVRRRQGDSLNQAIVTDMRPRIGLSYDVPAGGSLPGGVPLGSVAARDGIVYRRKMVGSSAQWATESVERVIREGDAVRTTSGEGIATREGSRLVRRGTSRWINIILGVTGIPINPNPDQESRLPVAKLWDQDMPMGPHPVNLAGVAYDVQGNRRAVSAYIETQGSQRGWLIWYWASTSSVDFGPAGGDRSIILTGSWETE